MTSTYCGEASRRTLGRTSCLISTSSWGLISQLVGLVARQPAPSQGAGKTSSSESCKVDLLGTEVVTPRGPTALTAAPTLAEGARLAGPRPGRKAATRLARDRLNTLQTRAGPHFRSAVGVPLRLRGRDSGDMLPLGTRLAGRPGRVGAKGQLWRAGPPPPPLSVPGEGCQDTEGA